MNTDELISIVIPVYDEEGNVRKLYEALTQELERMWCDFEIIFVDDGSRDRSADIIKEIHASDPRVKLVSFTRNFGHQMAITAGLEHARGTAVVTMDGDMQHPPSLVPDMIARWKEGFEVVHTIREDTADTGILKRFASSAFYRLINVIVDTRIVPAAADFRLLDRKVVDVLNGLRERNRFLRGLTAWVGFRQTSLAYVPAKRHAGKTKYSLRKMLSFAGDGITSFSTFPLKMSAYLGFLAAGCGVPYAVWAIYLRLFTDEAVSGWASLIVALLFLGGIQLICLGVLGEYVGKIYEEVKGRPLYISRERIGFDEAPVDPNPPKQDDGRRTTVSATSVAP
ncbi:MAG TPA: glycosyltransferase family 2 protein [Thermoguttaceae bacterium]|nr:glycosyltransferase family 2 protein [Thermoguttaceae bacterium]